MKKVIATCLTLCLSAALTLPASALDYTIDAPGDPDYGTPTSVEVIHTADGGAMKNEDVSKNAALIPPGFGTPSADTLGTGTYLTPNLAPGGMAVGTISGGSMPIVFPPVSDMTAGTGNTGGVSTSGGYTAVTDDLYYSGGYLGTLKIPSIGLTVKIYQGTGSSTLAKGAGHFTDTSIWDGTVALAGHNRGVTNHFGKIHTLEVGDEISVFNDNFKDIDPAAKHLSQKLNNYTQLMYGQSYDQESFYTGICDLSYIRMDDPDVQRRSIGDNMPLFGWFYDIPFRSVYKELHADRETGC